MEHLKGRLITDEELKQWKADSEKRDLEFKNECEKLGYNPKPILFGVMLLSELTDTDFEVKLSERYNLWERNLISMPIDIKKTEINRAKHELQSVYNSVGSSDNYPLYKKQKLEYLTTFIQKIEDAIHIGKLETMPTWAKETDLKLIWDELLLLKWIDAKDKSNFFKAFGISKDSEPFAKVSLCDSATKLMVLLAMMVDREKKILSNNEKRIANNLFSIELKSGTKLKPKEFERWSSELLKLSELRKSNKFYYDDYEPEIK